MSSFSRRQASSLAQQAATQRAELWQVTVTLGEDTTKFSAAKSPTKSTRIQQEQGAGWVQRNIATFLTNSHRTTRPAIGDEFTIIEDIANPINNGTTWRIFDLTPGALGEEDRCACFRLD